MFRMVSGGGGKELEREDVLSMVMGDWLEVHK